MNAEEFFDRARTAVGEVFAAAERADYKHPVTGDELTHDSLTSMGVANIVKAGLMQYPNMANCFFSSILRRGGSPLPYSGFNVAANAMYLASNLSYRAGVEATLAALMKS